MACQHKDGSTFFVSVEITAFDLDGKHAFRGIIRRVVSAKPPRPKAATDDYIFSGDLLGWYEITKTLGSGYFGKGKSWHARVCAFNIVVTISFFHSENGNSSFNWLQRCR